MYKIKIESNRKIEINREVNLIYNTIINKFNCSKSLLFTYTYIHHFPSYEYEVIMNSIGDILIEKFRNNGFTVKDIKYFNSLDNKTNQNIISYAKALNNIKNIYRPSIKLSISCD